MTTNPRLAAAIEACNTAAEAVRKAMTAAIREALLELDEADGTHVMVVVNHTSEGAFWWPLGQVSDPGDEPVQTAGVADAMSEAFCLLPQGDDDEPFQAFVEDDWTTESDDETRFLSLALAREAVAGS